MTEKAIHMLSSPHPPPNPPLIYTSAGQSFGLHCIVICVVSSKRDNLGGECALPSNLSCFG